MITYTNDLDMTPGGANLVIHLNQYDEDATLIFRLFSSKGDLDIESGTSVSIRGTKADGHGYSVAAAITGNIVTVPVDKQMTAAAGRNVFELSLVKDEKELNTMNFIVHTEPCAMDKDTISASPIRELLNVIDRTDEIIAAAAQADEAREQIEEIGEDVTEALRSAREYAGQAEESAEAAAQALQDVRQASNQGVLDIEEAMGAADRATLEEIHSIRQAGAEINEQIDEKAAAIAQITTDANQVAGRALSAAENAENDAAEAVSAIEGIRRTLTQMGLTLEGKVDDAYVEGGFLYMTSEGEIKVGPLGPFSGGGGGGGGDSGNNARITVANSTGWLSTTIADGDPCVVQITWSSLEDEMPTGDGKARITVNGAVKRTINIHQGLVAIDLAPYLNSGSNVVKVTILDVYDNARTINFSVDKVTVGITSPFDSTVPYQGAIYFAYTPVGIVQKTVHFIMDGREIGSTVTSVSGRQMSFSIPQQTHGPHVFECYFEADINGNTVYSNRLRYEIICLEPMNTTPIIVSPFNTASVQQYTTLYVEYSVYDPIRMEAPVTIEVNGSVVANLTVDRTQQVFTYRADAVGALEIEIASGSAAKALTLTVEQSDVEIEAETEQLKLFLTSAGRSNNEEHPEAWSFTDGMDTVEAVLTGFNWSRSGWINDSSGITALRVMGGARVQIPYQIFAGDPRTTGLTVEVEFATHNVMDYDAVILSCMNGGRGLQLTAQQAILSAEQTEVVAQYKEDEHIRVSFVVEKRSETRLVYIYIDGEMIGASQYPDNDDFSQPDPVGISIGSSLCGVDIYNIRVYSNNLTRYQVVNNWIADTQDVGLMLERYHHNDIYDEYGNIVITKLPADLPYMVIECAELPQYKGDKKTVRVTYVDPTGTARSFIADMAEADVQGTSSQYYEVKNIKIKFKNGLIVNGSLADGYALRPGEIPVKTFTYKADVASSEGANNVELVRLYEELSRELGILTPPQEEDERVRKGIDGFPIVIFWNNGTDTSFVGKYNFNNDKGTEETFGFGAGDESWETLSNTSMLSKFKTTVFGENWMEEDYEGRYPDGSTDNTNLEALTVWVNSTWQEAATGDTLAEAYTDIDGNIFTEDTAAYRLAKFKTEFEDWFDLEDSAFYYLFTLFFLMVDSRQKNAFPTRWAETGKWMWLPYDMDTALGTDNRGALSFGYHLEDTDMVGNEYVFNGQDSVLWVNFRQAYMSVVRDLYQAMRSSGKFDFDYVEAMFEEHQSKWPTALDNEDSNYKYLRPLVRDGNAAYLAMLQGSKRLQRRFWMQNRFDYIDSLFVAGNALTSYIMIRPYYNITEQERAAGAVDITITPYADIYATVAFDATRVQVRTTRETPTVIHNPLSYANDAVLSIYSANKLADVGDLAPLHLGYADFSMATRLQAIKVGDADPTYENDKLATLTVGTNPLIRTLDARNCIALGSADMKTIDLSGCPNIEEVYLDGTVITGVSLPNGGVLKRLHLPSTVTSLIIRNQTEITDLTIPDTSNITTLWIENVGAAVDSKDLLLSIPAASRVRLINIYWEAQDAEEIEDLLDILDTMRGLDAYGGNEDTAQVSGTIHTSSLTGAEYAALKDRYPYIVIDADHTTSYRTYADQDGTVAKRVACIDGVPQEAAPANMTKANSPDGHYSYSFVGWSKSMNATAADPDALDNVLYDRTVYAAYSETVRTYTVTWKNADNTTLRTDTNVAWGTTPSWGQTMPTYQGQTARGWTPSPGPITGNTTYTALYIPMYTATFVRAAADGGGTLYSAQFQQGTVPTYEGQTPTSTQGNDYTFIGWSPTPAAINANTTYTAVFKAPSDAPTSRDVTGAYAVEWDYSNNSPVLTRKGLAASFNNPVPAESNAGSGSSPFDAIQPWAGMKRYNVVNGIITNSEDDAGFTETEDTVVYIPEFYYTAWKDTANSKWTWAISPTQKEGYVKHPGSGRYVGRFHTSGSAEGVFTKSGAAPLANTSQTNFRTYSHNKGSKWFMLDLASWSAIQMLYLIEFGTFDSQTVLGKGWNTGSVSNVGGTTGAAYHTIKATGAHNQYRWIEDPFSNVMDNIDGFIADGRAVYAAANDNGYAGDKSDLVATGITLPSSNYITGFGYSEQASWAFLPNAASGGSESTYVTDRVSSNAGAQVARVGGDCSGSAYFGMFYLSAVSNASYTFANYGSRLLYIP